MTERREAQAVVLTGVYGVGKSSLAEELADILEKRHDPYAALDMDWLGWFDDGRRTDHGAADRVLLANLSAVVANYRGVGIRRFVLAGWIGNEREREDVRSVLDMPMTVIRLTVPFEEIERRLGTAATTGRKDDLRVAAGWLEQGAGEGIEDFIIANDRPIHDVASEVLDLVGWS